MMIVVLLMRLWLILFLSAAAPLNPMVDKVTTEENLVTKDTASVNIMKGDDMDGDRLHSHTSQDTIRDARLAFYGENIILSESINIKGDHAHIASIITNDVSEGSNSAPDSSQDRQPAPTPVCPADAINTAACFCSSPNGGEDCNAGQRCNTDGTCQSVCLVGVETFSDCFCKFPTGGSGSVCTANKICGQNGNCLDACTPDETSSTACSCTGAECTADQGCTWDGKCLDVCVFGESSSECFCKVLNSAKAVECNSNRCHDGACLDGCIPGETSSDACFCEMPDSAGGVVCTANHGCYDGCCLDVCSPNKKSSTDCFCKMPNGDQGNKCAEDQFCSWEGTCDDGVPDGGEFPCFTKEDEDHDLGSVAMTPLFGRRRRSLQNSDRLYKWENNIIPYVFTDTSDKDKDLFRRIMDKIEGKSWPTFQEKHKIEDENEHILEISTDNEKSCTEGCLGFVSRVRNSERIKLISFTQLTDKEGCKEKCEGFALHELFHVLGMGHTFNRKDRDDFITLNDENLKTMKAPMSQFEKCEHCLLYKEVPYDCNSIMHYGTHKGDTELMAPKDTARCDLKRNAKLLSGPHGSDLDWKLLNIIGKVEECLTSPGYPDRYPASYNAKSDVRQNLKVEDGRAMEITFHHFDVEEHTECSYDYLQFFDGNGKTIGEKLCGKSLPEKLTISTSKASAVFRSNINTELMGYKFCYKPVDCLTSSDFKQKLEVEDGRAMAITFHDFDVENNIKCSFDYIEFFDGDKKSVGKKLCGKSLPKKFTIPTSTASFEVNSNTQQKEYKFCYKPVDIEKCVTSPGYPDNYPARSEVRQILPVEEAGRAIEITFYDFDVERHKTCSSDYLEFFDGNQKSVGGKLCTGKSLPQPLIISTVSASASFVFISDLNVQHKGYKFCYKTVCAADEFSCLSGQCIPSTKKCDETNDCYDGSDEINCEKSGSLKLDASDVPYLLIGSKWKPICGHSFWDNNIGADIVCLNLGYSQGGVVHHISGQYSEDAYYVGRCDSKSITDLENGCTKEVLAHHLSCKKGSPVSIKVECKVSPADASVPATCSSSSPQYIPDPTDCQVYYLCDAGHAPARYTCAGSMRWSTTINTCDHADNVPCPRTGQTSGIIVDGGWSAWSSWNDCTGNCEEATKTRTRACSNPAGDKSCPGAATQTESCDLPSCEGCPTDETILSECMCGDKSCAKGSVCSSDSTCTPVCDFNSIQVLKEECFCRYKEERQLCQGGNLCTEEDGCKNPNAFHGFYLGWG